MLKLRHGWIAVILLAVEIATATVLLRPRASVSHAQALTAQHMPLIQRLIGTWHDDYQADRTLTIRADGTATMICQLRGMHRFFATQLLFEQEWRLEGDRLTFHTVSGVPQKKIDFVVKLKGATTRQIVRQVTDSLLHVYDEGEATEFHWERVPDSSTDHSQLLADIESRSE